MTDYLGCPRGVPLLYIPATRIHLQVQPLHTESELQPFEAFKRLFDTSTDVFHGEYVEPAVQGILRDYPPPDDPDSYWGEHDLDEALQRGYACAKEICGEVIHGRTSHSFVDLRPGSIAQGPEAIVHPGMGIVTTDRILGEPLYTGALSAGTQGTLLWIWALALKMSLEDPRDYSYGNPSPSAERPAVLLVDEIENHLHPTWQRRVIPALLKHFPSLQIFATTHSPFVVAGLKSGQVHLLRPSTDFSLQATTNTEDVVGWTADEILRNMMGVDDPTDDATAAAARELRQLRNEMPLAEEEAEAQRQERMQELRKRVDRDLLAGGPMAAQRERFEEDLAKILEEHRKSRDLSQDNG